MSESPKAWEPPSGFVANALEYRAMPRRNYKVKGEMALCPQQEKPWRIKCNGALENHRHLRSENCETRGKRYQPKCWPTTFDK